MQGTLLDLITPTAKLTLKGPNGEDLPIVLKIQGLNVATLKQKALEANVFLMQAGKAEQVDNIVKNLNKTEAAACELAGMAIVGWDSEYDQYMGGEFTPEYAKELMKMEKLSWVREQVNKFIQDKSNFFRDKPAVVDADTNVAA